MNKYTCQHLIKIAFIFKSIVSMCSIIVLSLKSPHNFPAATVTSLIEFISPCSILSLESAYVGIFCFKCKCICI